MGRGGYASGDRDPQTRVYTGKGDCLKYAGRTGIRCNRPDRVYCQEEKSGYMDAKVVATGGLGKIIAQETDCIDEYDPELTLNGLRLIYYKNIKR